MLDVSLRAEPGGRAIDPERRWVAEVYQPDARQLTVRAALAGCVLGAVMALSNLYVVLKTGWSLGVTITACILAFAFFRGARAARLARTEFGPLENNAMASVASSAGYMTGGGNMAALAGARDAHRRSARRRAARRLVRRDRGARRVRRHPHQASARQPRAASVPDRHRDRGDDPRPPRPPPAARRGCSARRRSSARRSRG